MTAIMLMIVTLTVFVGDVDGEEYETKTLHARKVPGGTSLHR